MRFSLTTIIVFFAAFIIGQENPNPLPKHLTKEEIKQIEAGDYQVPYSQIRGITKPPSSKTRTIGEWEELQSIVVTWDAFYSTLREIVRYAKEEVEVINICEDSTTIKNYLEASNIDSENLVFIEAPFNTVWVRDYGPNPVYTNDVDSLVLIDWIYNRPRPADDVTPDLIGDYLQVPVYCTTEAPYDMVHTGGNFMSDGLGAGFSSKLILEENDATNQFGTSNHSEEDIEQIINQFMGIDIYPKMDVLPYDGINHIDMHMKLLDEETILIGEFPLGVSDGPQIEENIQFILDNYKTYWGTDYKIERIIQPPCGNGNYPPSCQSGAEYRTYTNALFINKTILVPIYNIALDEIALERWRELMPGYNIQGIDCRQIINSGGAIHCVTKEIGTNEPLWIAHKNLEDVLEADNTTDYAVEAIIKHKDGISSAQIFWTTDPALGYTVEEMSLANESTHEWLGYIPQQTQGAQLCYYIQAASNSGKIITRPLVAPEGNFDFEVESLSVSTIELVGNPGISYSMYPNPAVNYSILTFDAPKDGVLDIQLSNETGQIIKSLFKGQAKTGKNYIYLDLDDIITGNYYLNLKSAGDERITSLKLLVQD